MSKDNRTDLHLAIIEHDSDLAIKLIEEGGVDLNAQDSLGFTPLHYSGQERNIEVTKMLVNKGANPNLTDNYGNNPLWRSLGGDSQCNEIIKILLDAGSDPAHENDSGVSVISHVTKLKSHKNRHMFDLKN